MKKKLLAGLATALLLAGSTTTASASSIAHYSVQGGWNDDYAIWVGVGDIADPSWQEQVAWTANNFSSETTGSIDLPEAFVWGNTWWLHAEDNIITDTGSIMMFSITTGQGSYSAPEPIFITDLQDGYAYIDMSEEGSNGGNNGENPVPEPATILLMGAGLAGLIGARRKKKA